MDNLTGSWKKHCDYRFFSGEDCIKPLTLKIKSSKMEEIYNTKLYKKENVPVLYFENTKLGFVLGNKINPKQIEINLKSPNMETWIGKQITLFAQVDKVHGHVIRIKKIPSTQKI